jgi:hypothetical protein
VTRRWARRLCTCSGLLLVLASVGCRCGSGSRPARPTVSPPASQPAASQPASRPVDDRPARRAALQKQQLELVDAVAEGRGDLGALYQGAGAHVQAEQASGGLLSVARLQAIYQENFEFLHACRQVGDAAGGHCGKLAPVGAASVARCNQFVAGHALFRNMLVRKQCDPASLTTARAALNLDARQAVAFCEGVTRSDPARCAATPQSVRVLCDAVARKDESKCGAGGAGRGECAKNYKVMRALLTGDRAALPQEPGMEAFARLLLDQPADCAQAFKTTIRRDLGAAAPGAPGPAPR